MRLCPQCLCFSCFVVCPMLAVFLHCPFLIALSGFYNVSLMTFSISENTNIKIFHRKHQRSSNTSSELMCFAKTKQLKLMWFLTATFSMINCALKKNLYYSFGIFKINFISFHSSDMQISIILKTHNI
jgi:hypothetical protein